MAREVVSQAIAEVRNNRKECLGLLKQMKAFHASDAQNQYPQTYRLIATPMLYSAWERCFTLCHAIGLRLIRDTVANPLALDAGNRAVWLMQTAFYQSLVSKIKNAGNPEAERLKKGHFASLSEFLVQFDAWSNKAIDPTISTTELVLTFSNVNPDVVKLNAEAIGLAVFPSFQSLKLGKLHDLVGRRNEIGHGAVIEPPSNESFIELWKFTEKLISDYCHVFVKWIQTEFEPIKTVKRARGAKK